VGSPAWQPFSVTVSTDGDRSTVELRGELDLAGVDRAREAIEQAERAESPLLVLDLSQLEFIDSTGIAVLLEAHRDFDREHGAGVRAVEVDPVEATLVELATRR